jgi:hypothetical protein
MICVVTEMRVKKKHKGEKRNKESLFPVSRVIQVWRKKIESSSHNPDISHLNHTTLHPSTHTTTPHLSTTHNTDHGGATYRSLGDLETFPNFEQGSRCNKSHAVALFVNQF